MKKTITLALMVSSMALTGFAFGNSNDNTALNAQSATVITLDEKAAIYPNDALKRKREGYVILEYSLSVDGSIKNIKIVEAQPSRLFTRAAKKALRNSKFAPPTVDGKPVAVAGLHKRYEFRMDQGHPQVASN